MKWWNGMDKNQAKKKGNSFVEWGLGCRRPAPRWQRQYALSLALRPARGSDLGSYRRAWAEVPSTSGLQRTAG